MKFPLLKIELITHTDLKDYNAQIEKNRVEISVSTSHYQKSPLRYAPTPENWHLDFSLITSLSLKHG